MEEKSKSFPDVNAEAQHNLTSLTFVVNGDEEIIDKVNLNQPLKVAAERALKESGNTARPLSDYQVLYLEKEISLEGKVKDYNFPASALIYLNLNQAGGG